MRPSTRSLILVAITLALIAISVLPTFSHAQNIGQLEQFTATTSPTASITQRVFGKILRLTGYAAGCAEFTANGTLTSTGVACGSGSSSGTVTSVDMTVPTGLQVSGNPISTSGTLAVTYASGYAIPTTAKQTQWDTAYANRITSATSPLSIVSNVISIANSAADGTTKGAASFTAPDFDATTGNISIDYTNGQKATGSVPGFLTAADWNTFNNKLTTAVTLIGPAGQTSDGPTVTLATSTSAFNGLTPNLVITGSGDTQTFTSSLSGTLGVGGGGTGATSLSGIVKGNGTSPFTAAVNGTDYTLITAKLCTGNDFLSGVTAAGVFTCSTPTGGSGSGLSTSSPVSAGNVLVYSSAGAGSAYGVATSTPTLSAEFSYTGTLGRFVTGTDGTLSLATNGVALTKIAQIGANTILGNPTGATANVTAFATSSLGIAISDTTGTLTVPRGGTGQTSFTAGNLIYGAGTGALQNVATSSVAAGTGVSFTGTPGALVGGTSLTINNTGVISGSCTAPVSCSGTNPLAITTTPGTFAGSGTYNFPTVLGIASTTPWATLAVNPTAGTAANQFVVGSSTATNFIITNAGNTGIGTSSPSKLLYVQGDQSGGIVRFHRINVSTSGVLGTFDVLGESTGTMANGFGVAQTFSIAGASAAPTIVGQLAYERRGANNTSIGKLFSYNAGAVNVNASLYLDGSVGASGIGTTTPQWTFTLASSSRPQLTLTDASLTSAPFNFRANANFLTIGTSSPTTFATTSLPILELNSLDGVVRIPNLSAAAGTFVAADPTGRLIATTSPVSGDSPAGSGSELQARLTSTTFQALTGSAVTGSALSINGQLSVGSTTYNGILPLVKFATSTVSSGVLGGAYGTTTPQIANQVSTSFFAQVISGARWYVGNFVERFGILLDEFSVDGTISTGEWMLWDCHNIGTNGVSVNTGIACGDFGFTEASTGTLDNSAVSNQPYYLSLGSGGSSGNAGMLVLANSAAVNQFPSGTTTPRLRTSARMAATSGGGAYFIGWANVSANKVADGCAFTASSTRANWYFVCRNNVGGAETNVDTGISSTTQSYIDMEAQFDNAKACPYVRTATTARTSLACIGTSAGYDGQLDNLAVQMSAYRDINAARLDFRYFQLWARFPLFLN